MVKRLRKSRGISSQRQRLLYFRKGPSKVSTTNDSRNPSLSADCNVDLRKLDRQYQGARLNSLLDSNDYLDKGHQVLISTLSSYRKFLFLIRKLIILAVIDGRSLTARHHVLRCIKDYKMIKSKRKVGFYYRTTLVCNAIRSVVQTYDALMTLINSCERTVNYRSNIDVK